MYSEENSVQFEESSSPELQVSETSFKAKSLLKKDFKHLRLVFLLNFFIGLYFGYFSASIYSDLFTQGTIQQDSKSLSFITLPFTLQILWAILLDNCHIRILGKRKGFIVIATSLICIITFITSFRITQFIQQKDFSSITIIGLSIMFLLTFIQISADGWVINYISEENTCYAALCRIFGQQLGVIISYNIYINSQNFTSDILFKSISGGLFLLTLYLIMKVSENNYQSDTEVKQALRTSFQLIKQPFFQHLSFFILIFNLGFGSIEIIGVQKVLDSRIILQNPTVDYFQLLIQLIAAIILCLILQKNNNHLTILSVGFSLRLITNSLFFYCLWSQKQYIIMKCFVAYQLVQSVNFTLIAVSLFGFLFQIATHQLAGTTISFFVLISIMEIGNMIMKDYSTFADKIIDFKTAYFIGLVFCVLLFGIYYKKLKELQEMPKLRWKII